MQTFPQLRIVLAFCLVLNLTSLAYAYGGMGRGRGGSPQNSDKPKTPSWPGNYNCVQCLPSAATTPEADAATPDKPPAGCWSYQLTISKEGGSLAAVLKRVTHDQTETVKAIVTSRENQLDLAYAETVGKITPPLPFKVGDVLVTLNLRENDYFLRFKAMETKVKDQTAVTCEKR
jgi:hypothetical protein